MENTQNDYIQYPIKVSAKYRQDLINKFPNLENHPNSNTYRKMLEYICYWSWKGSHDEDEGLIFPAETIARMSNREGDTGFRAIDYLNGFSRDIFTLEIGKYWQGHCRRIKFSVPTEIGIDEFDDGEKLVWFVSGAEVSPKSRRKYADSYIEQIRLLVDGVDTDHPAYELMKYLNNQAQTNLGKHIRNNWNNIIRLFEDMPEETDEEYQSKLSAGFVLRQLEDTYKMYYGPSDRTSRIYVKGVSLHSLPRNLRKAALSGAIELDIKSSQLAIVAKLWNLDTCNKFLSTGESFWSMMLNYLKLDTKYKDNLKDTVYALCFGMSKRKLVRNLSNGIGTKKALLFFKHELIKEILKGRSKQMMKVYNDGGMVDAFGRWYELSKEFPAHSILAIVAQSHELKLMLSVFDTVKDDDYLSILSWLHDGVVIHPTRNNETWIKNKIKLIKANFDNQANKSGFTTELEVTYL